MSGNAVLSQRDEALHLANDPPGVQGADTSDAVTHDDAGIADDAEHLIGGRMSPAEGSQMEDALSSNPLTALLVAQVLVVMTCTSLIMDESRAKTALSDCREGGNAKPHVGDAVEGRAVLR